MPPPRNEDLINIPPYEMNVLVPVNGENNPHYESVDNIVVLIENDLNIEEEDKDFIDIHAEADDLPEI